MSNLRNKFSKSEMSLINHRASQLAGTSFLLHQQALMRYLAQKIRHGVEITPALVQNITTAIADDLADFEEGIRS